MISHSRVLAAEVVALGVAVPHVFVAGTIQEDLAGDALAGEMLGAWIVFFVLANMHAAFEAVATDGGVLYGQDMESRVLAPVVGLVAVLPYSEGYRLTDLARKQIHSECVKVATLEDNAAVLGSWCDEHCSWTTAENHSAAAGCAGDWGKVHHWILVGRQTARGG